MISIALLVLPACPHIAAQGLDDLEHSVAEADELLQQAKAAHTDREVFAKANQSLSIARDLRYDGGIARASVLLAQVCVRTNRIEEALQFFLEAEEKLAPGGGNMPLVLDRSTLLDVYLGLGDLFFQEKLFGNARRYYRRALEFNAGNYSVLGKVADTFLQESRYDSAELAYKPLIAHYDEQGDYPHLVQVYQKLANAEGRPAADTSGLVYYRRVEEILEHHGYPEERAVMYNNMGKQYAVRSDYVRALEYFRKAELQCGYINCDYLDVVYANLGIALHNTGDTKKGIGYLLDAAQVLTTKKDWHSLASLEHLIAGVYFSDRDIYNALSHVNEAIRLAKETNQKDVLARSYSTAADVHYRLYDFENAYKAYREYLKLDESMRQQHQARQQRIEQQRAQLSAAESQIKYLITRQNLKELDLQQARYDKERLELKNENLELDRQRREDEVRLLQAQKNADQAALREQILTALQARSEKQLALQELDAEKQAAAYRHQQQSALAQRQADSTRVAQLRRDKAFQQREQDNFKQFAYGLGSLGLVIVVLMGLSWGFARRSNRRMKAKNREIEQQKALIEEERHKSDQLLLNILPGEVAQELRAYGYATPRFYERATVVFTDFLNFTSLSEKLTPEQLIDELDACFLGFDEICERHGLEKIKTIGDAYMCAGGLPVPNDTHPTDAVSAALEMMSWLTKRNETHPKAVFTAMRVGVHTGPVIAGVIGKNKFAYDIWGDAVNLASRLEELGEPGQINISGATHEAVKHHFVCTYRGKKDVHNKGLIDMYFVNPLAQGLTEG
ncbi:MAG: adenylate/guanylate cyclase domain-containing protein [Saprospiraceae bacterium]